MVDTDRQPAIAALTVFAVSVAVSGCGSQQSDSSDAPPSSTHGRASGASPAAASQPATAVARIDSPAFATAEQAVRQWHQAIRENGEPGHLRTTFDETDNWSRESWEKLQQRYEPLVGAPELEILETLERGPYAAVVVRGGPRVDVVCLCRDDAGWHVSRRLSDFLSVGLKWNQPGTTERYKVMTELAGAASTRAAELAQATGENAADSAGFETPEKALEAWLEAYQADGIEGHVRTTVDRANTPDGEWQEILLKEYAVLPPSGALEVLEMLTRESLAAAVVQLGGKVRRICLLRDASGWRVSRIVKDWPLSATGDYEETRQLRKLVGSFSADVTVKELEWYDRLATEATP